MSRPVAPPPTPNPKVIYRRPSDRYMDGYGKNRPWRVTTGPAFCATQRGFTTHRVRYALLHCNDSWARGRARLSATFWCGNFSPHVCPKPYVRVTDRICWRCEMMATQAGEKTSEELLGRSPHFTQPAACRLTTEGVGS